MFGLAPRLPDPVREVLRDAFSEVKGVQAVYAHHRGQNIVHLDDQARINVDLETLEATAFEAFQSAVDRLTMEHPDAPYFVWNRVIPYAHCTRLTEVIDLPSHRAPRKAKKQQ